jgi:hypothetical protein
MEFIDGSITELQTLKSLSQATRHTRLRPGMGYGLKMNVDLITGTGTVGQEGTVVIDFKSQSISVEGINETSAEVVQYFSNWLQNNNVTYEVGQISMAALGTGLTPTSFIIRTQPASDAAKTNGRYCFLWPPIIIQRGPRQVTATRGLFLMRTLPLFWSATVLYWKTT